MPKETISITGIEHDILQIFVKYKLFKNKDIFAILVQLMEKMVK